jgi:hypothetical protein
MRLRLAAGGCVNLYLERYRLRFIIYLVAPLIFNSNYCKVLPAVLQKLGDSQISSGDAYKPFQEDFHYLAETFQKAIHYHLANSKREVESRMQ